LRRKTAKILRKIALKEGFSAADYRKFKKVWYDMRWDVRGWWRKELLKALDKRSKIML